MTARVFVRCLNCGETDDHPKHHYGDQTYHHDCLPAHVADDVFGGLETVHLARLRKITEAAKNGTRGDDLHAFIAQLHVDMPNEEEPADE